MDLASDDLNYTKYLEYDRYSKYKYEYDPFDLYPYKKSSLYKRLEQKLHGQLFDCPNCYQRSVKVSVGKDLRTDIYLIRAYCCSCCAYSVMEVSSLTLKSANFDLMSDTINDAVYALGNVSENVPEVDLDAMIDEDWKLAGG